MTCLVAGGTGFYGMWIAKKLAEQGVDVVAFDLYSFHPEDRIWHLDGTETIVDRGDKEPTRRIWVKEIESKITIERGDARHMSDLLSVFKKYKIDSVVNTVTFIHGFGASPQDRFLTNALTTFNLLEAARAFDVGRFVQITTTGVYPQKKFFEKKWVGGYEPVTEEHPTTSAATHASDYHSTKVFSEAFCQRYHDLYGLDYVSLRPSTSYGPGRRIWQHWPGNYTKLIMDAARGKETHYEVGGDDLFDAQYISDFADAVVLVHQAKELPHRIYNVVPSDPVPFREFLSILNSVTGLNCTAGPGEFAGPPGAQGRFSNERIRKDLGWQPKYSIEAALKEYVAHLQREVI